MPQVSLSLQEIYARLCPKCKKVVKQMVKEKMTDQAIEDSLEGKEAD